MDAWYRGWLWMVVVAAVACSKVAAPAVPAAPVAPAVVEVAGVRVADLTAPDQRPEGYTVPDVASWADDELSRARVLKLAKDHAGAPTVSVALLYGVVTAEHTASRTPLAGAVLTAGVQINLALATAGEPPLAFQAERIAEQPLTEADATGFAGTLSRLLEGLVRGTVRQLDGKLALHRGDASVVLAALAGGDDDGLTEYAATLAGERSLYAAAPQLIALLTSPATGLRLRAIGALGQLKSAEAVTPLATLAAEATTPREIGAAVQALADIGGPEARRYLEGLKASTPFDEVRTLVERVLSATPATP